MSAVAGAPPPVVLGVGIGGPRGERKTPLRLPSLGGRGDDAARLSLSEASPHQAKDNPSFETRCCVRPPPPPPPLLALPPSCKSEAHQPAAPGRRRKDFPSIRSSRAVRLCSGPRSRTPAAAVALGPPLSVTGKPCVLIRDRRPVAGPARPQLHVFPPAETQEEETDAESADELDCKMASLGLRREDANPPPPCVARSV
ncbi:potassium/sodium hyperpolarization-activated cyclic nucleotide-gated channel 4-like [Phyllopteryx taeniolatus]|uniref:potassium/sodium hyperpolarization-activated cyclic nucleotide-gated channel 4-like n=1 Tax=Phyllopteryx taeniolatus TaxID=161469 RepID=UPI002AD25B52|nr:potassium/sodium hyperpolarization-activated cyclic nucleotide-gated channel 4-like [Phyllopteryx taeniolatus]